VIPDADIVENRVQAFIELPWAIAAVTVIEMRDEDLDNLDAAYETDRYWSVLNRIVTRIESDRKETK